MEYFQDIFYLKSRNLSPDVWKEICIDAKSKCKQWNIDDKSTRGRRTINMSFKESLLFLNNNDIHFNVIHRRGYENWRNNEYFSNKWCLEISFCTMGIKNMPKNLTIKPEGDIFLWIYLDESYIGYFLNKYNLK